MGNRRRHIGSSLAALTLTLSLLTGLLTGCGPGGSQSSSPEAGSTPPAASQSTQTPEQPALPELTTDTYGNAAVGYQAAVVSANEYTSRIGMDILEAGGNAVDAAVAMIFANSLTEPGATSLGGASFMTIYLKETGEYICIEAMETAPAAAGIDTLDEINEKKGAMLVTVPGQVHGALTALEKYGTMTPEEVMAPAIKLAREGFPIEERLANAIMDSFDMISANEEAAAIYTNDGLPYATGDLFKNEPLADTLEAIAKGGIEEFYTGELAQKMVDGLQANGSLMAMEDLATYTVAEREPIRTEYYGYEVVTVPPPSNGGDWLLEMLNIMEEKDISQYDPSTLEYQYIFNEACRIGLVDSYTYIGDPAFYDLPVEEMISDEFAAERAALIDMDNMQAMESVPLSDLPVTKLEPTAEESQHTTHIAVIDQYGNIVSTTNTLGNGWGCKFMAPGLGFFYNSHIGNLDHENPDSPDYVMPGKRVRSTISPSLVLQDGNPIMAVGSPGSLAIPPAVATIINNVLLYGMNVQQAINEPRAMAINRSGMDSPARVSIEQPRFDPDLVAQMEGIGYEMKDVGEYNMAVGGIAAIYLDRDNGIFYAGADPRRGYKALAY